MTNFARRYVSLFLGVSVSILITIAGLNYLVDPYDILGRNTLGVYVTADRESRVAFLKRYQPDAVIMGNSKAAMIDVSKIDGYRFFSVTFGGATIEELYFFAKNHLRDLKLAVLALDFSMFGTDPPIIEKDPFGTRDPGFYTSYLLSIGTAEDSVQTISRFLRGKPQAFREDGSYIAEKWAQTKDVPNNAIQENEFAMEKESYRTMRFSQERMQTLRRLRDLLAGRNIPIVAVINPLHQRSVDLLANSPAAQQARSWAGQVRELFPLTVDLSSSEYSAPRNFFAADPVHYKPAVGVRFMQNEVLPAVESGVIDSTVNLEHQKIE